MITKFFITDPERGIVEEHSILEMTEEELHNLVYYAYPTWCRIVKVEEVGYTMDEMHNELHNQLVLSHSYDCRSSSCLRSHHTVWENNELKTACKFCKEELDND